MAHAHDSSSERPAILDKVRPAELPRSPLILNNRGFHWITDKVCGIVEEETPLWWKIMFGVALFVASFTFIGLAYLVSTGTGTWGLRSPVGWGWAIVNFVFWVGIGHAGTLISAILCLLRQKWRTSINRAAEAMTIFAVCCAGLFPLFHVGRDREDVPLERGAELRPDTVLIRQRQEPPAEPDATDVEEREDTRAHDREDGHGFGGAVDRSAPLLTQEAEDC